MKHESVSGKNEAWLQIMVGCSQSKADEASRYFIRLTIN